MFKVPYHQLQSTLVTAFWKIAYSWRFRSSTKIQLPLQRTLHKNRWYFTYFLIRFFFFQANIAFKFNQVLISTLHNFGHNFFTFFFFLLTNDIIQILKYIQCLYAFLIRIFFVIFCVSTSHSRNILNLLLIFCHIEPLCSYRLCPYRKVYNILGNYNGIAVTELIRSTAMEL